MIPELDSAYWESRYSEKNTGWDIGYPSPPLTDYFDSLLNKDLKILIPGAGNAYEAEYLHQHGFTNVQVLDLTEAPFQRLLSVCPDFDRKKLIVGDFFDHIEGYDLIVEQTFFCALDPSLRKAYVEHMHACLKPDGLLVGLLFNDPLFTDHPPFGGNRSEYFKLFEPFFDILIMETAKNSIPPRAGRELFIKLKPKTL